MSALQLGDADAGPDVSQILLKMKRGISKWQVASPAAPSLDLDCNDDGTGSHLVAHRLTR